MIELITVCNYLSPPADAQMDEQDLNEPLAKVSLLKGTLTCFYNILNQSIRFTTKLHVLCEVLSLVKRLR